MKNRHVLNKEDSLFLMIDIQDSLAKAMAQEDDVKKNAGILAETAKILGIDTIFTTQYEKGLGKFNQEILDKTVASEIYDKTAFSCMIEDDFKNIIKKYKPKSIVVAGIEAHICVLLTVRDLLNDGYEVYVAADAVSSRNPLHALYALEEMRELGAVIRPTESILFDLCSVAGTDDFKAIQKLIK